MAILKKCWFAIPLKVAISVAVGGIFLSTQVIWADDYGLAKTRQDSLLNRLQRTLSLAVQYPPTDFLHQIEKVGGNNPLIYPIDENEAGFSADIWAFFLRSESDVSRLPQVVQEVFSVLPPAEEMPISHYIEFTLTDGTPKAVIFYFSDNVSSSEASDRTCAAAVRLYSAVLGTSDEKVLDELLSRCISN